MRLELARDGLEAGAGPGGSLDRHDEFTVAHLAMRAALSYKHRVLDRNNKGDYVALLRLSLPGGDVMKVGLTALLIAAVASLLAPGTASASGIVVTPESLPNAEQGHGYYQELGWQADGVTVSPPVTFAVTAGRLPEGFRLTASGSLSGGTQELGPMQFDVTATDTAGHSGTRSYTLWVLPDTSLADLAVYLVEGAVRCAPAYVSQLISHSFPRPC
jgi:hypothetical protein